jgi:hypothetical protein
VLDDETPADDGRPDAKSVLEGVLKSAERSPILRIDLAHVSGPAPNGVGAEPLPRGSTGERGITAIDPGGVLQSRDAANTALREIELTLARFGDIRRMPADPQQRGMMRLQARMTPSGFRKFVEAMEANGIGRREGEAGAAKSGIYEFERGSLEVFGPDASGAETSKITVELRIELPE